MRQRNEISSHMDFAAANPNTRWELRHWWDRDNGWRVEWLVAGVGLKLDPIAARQLVRNRVADLNTPMQVSKLPAELREQLMFFFGEMDRLAKEALHNNRTNKLPPGITA